MVDPEYFAGLFDAEGTATVVFKEKRRQRFGIATYPQLCVTLKYVAGLFDGEGCVGIRFVELETYRYGVGATPHLSLGMEHPLAIRLLKAVSSSYGGSLTINKERNSVMWRINKPDEVELVVDMLLPYCVIKHEQLRIMKEEILPIFKEKKHLTVEGLRKLIEIDKKLHNKGTRRRDWSKVLDENLERLGLRKCIVCGEPIMSTHRNTKYCWNCVKEKYPWAAKHLLKVRGV